MKQALRRLVVILLLTAVILLVWLTASESGLRWAYQLAGPYLPGRLMMTSLEGRLMGPITVRGIEYQQGDALIKADQIILDWLPSALLTANINISRLQIQSLNIVMPKTEKTESAQTQVLALPEIHLPWRVVLKDVLIDNISFSQGEQTLGLQQIRLNATTLFSQVDIEELSVKTDTFSLDIKGELHPVRNYRHELETRWRARLPSSAVIEGQGKISGDMKMTLIKQQLSGPLQLTLDAKINDLLGKLNWQAKIDVTAFDATQLQASWPAVSGKLTLNGNGDLTTATLSGTLDGNYPELGPFDAGFNLQRLSDNTLQIDDLMLHTPVSDTILNARGQWIPGTDGGDISVAMHWQKLRWPLKDPAWFDSTIGSGWIEGNINHYRFGLATDRPWPQAPPSTWYASAEGNLDGLTFHPLRVTALDGETIATGQLNWLPQLVWQAQVKATGINPSEISSLGPQWPGQINATLTNSGRIEHGQLLANADIIRLTGMLRGYPVSLRSRLSWHDNGLDIALFDFHSGGAQIKAQGRIGETLDLDYTIAATDLAELYPQAQGQFRVNGLLTGSRDAPMINASLNGTAIRLPGYEIGAIDGAAVVDLFRWQHIDIKLAAQTLSIKGYALSSLDINADTHRLEVKAVSETETAFIELNGETDAKGWRGHLERADIQSRRFADWQLKTPAALNISERTLMVAPLCWHNNQEASFCASLQHEDERWQSQIEMNTLPLMLLSPWLPVDLKLEGVVNATAKLQFAAPDQLLGDALIELPPGVINYPLLEGERDQWEYRGGKVEISLKQQGLEANADIAMSHDDRFHGWLRLPGARPLVLDIHSQPLQANAQLNIHDLGLIEAIVPEVHNLRGVMEMNLSAAGTLARPNWSGRANFLNGALSIPRLGLSIDQISLKSQSDGLEKLDFRLNARSGDGTLAIQGQTKLDSSAGWPTEVSIKGKDFEISRIPEAQILVSPDLQVKLKKQAIDINGDVHIPYAKLQPKDVTTAARVSKDTVIVNGEQVTVDNWSINTRIRLTLGERVSFYGFGFEGRFGGSLLLEDEPGQLTKATGELSIPEGRYRAYGQRLDVEQGRLLYTGGPLTNPGIDLRAVRHISGITAGLKVRGNLYQPQIELFSIPAMDQTDTLAYLLLGHPIENASGEEGAMMASAALALGLSGGDRLARTLGSRFGLDEMRVESNNSGDQASLVIGRYLSPKLYVSYGVGLIEAINTLSVRYQLSDKWQLKTESGEYQGADILYTIKR